MVDEIEWSTVPALGAGAARRHADAVAVDDGELALTFAELHDVVRSVARGAIACGVEPGDRVAVWAPNSTKWVLAALGLQAAGGILVPVNTRFRGAEAAWVLQKSGARHVFTVNGFLGLDYARLVLEAETGVAEDHIIVMDGQSTGATLPWEGFLERAAQVPAGVADDRAAAVTGDDVADILFTSGTTGRPKGAMTTHHQNLEVYDVYARSLGLRAGDRHLVLNPFFHCFGYKAGVLSSLLRGATILPHAVFDVPAVLDRIERDRITVLPGPPTLLQGILDHPDRDRHDLSSLRLTITGAASVPVELIRRLRGEMSFETVLTGYGLTETSGVVAVCDAGDDPETVSHWCGRAIPGTSISVVDDDGNDVPLGEEGEVLVSGYNVMRGYWDDPEGTAAAFDGHGRLRTGDVGVMDARGYLKITDRKKDMFIVGGFNAYPAEIENILCGHEAVAQCAIIGVPDERLGEVGKAFVVLRPGLVATPDQLVQWSRENMANFKVPRHVEIVDQLPVNASGKVTKFELRSQHRAQASAAD